ncbi:MAG: cbb3-type cytochrome c oxidase subunit I [Thermaerobacterales bacterium]
MSKLSQKNDGAPAGLYRQDGGHILAHLFVSFGLLAVGGAYGTLQALDKMGVDLYPLLPGVLRFYYTGLTVHGVTLAILFTAFFIMGFLSLAVVHGLRRPLADRGLAWAAFAIAATGLFALMVPTFRNQASVLWTFYAPLRAHPGFYLGLALVALASWMTALNTYLTWRGWKAENADDRTPLMAFAALTTWAMWVLASVGLAGALAFQLLPWALQIQETVNPLLTRALFWFSGHPLVYFWLLPAYLSWYTMLPAQVGGRLFSESLARLVFLLFIPLSIPTGLHHMYTDPGVAHGSKVFHGILTYAVIFPSLVTAFTVVASIEDGARRNGGRGRLKWLLALPWFTNPSVAAQLLAMLIFATGGITGLLNASLNMNLILHNSMWVVGHLHTQVGAAVTLTFMGISYWLVPLLTGRSLWRRRWAVIQVWSWFFGAAIMARGMHWLGLAGGPRRTYLTHADYAVAEWWQAGLLTGVGGMIMTVSGLLFLLNITVTLWNHKKAGPLQVPEAEPLHRVERMPVLLDRITPWVLLTVVLAALAWGLPLWRAATTFPSVPGYTPW